MIELSAPAVEIEPQAATRPTGGWPAYQSRPLDPRRILAMLLKRLGLVAGVALTVFLLFVLFAVIAPAVASAPGDLQHNLSQAVAPKRIRAAFASPDLDRRLVIAALAAVGAGLLAALIVEWFDATLTTAADVERRLRCPYLGYVPTLASMVRKGKLSPAKYVVDKPLSAFSEAFRDLRAAIAHSAGGEPVKVVALTSTVPGEGKTTTALCLARAAALQGVRVVLVDCDLRRRSVNALLPSEPEHGLVEALNRQIPVQQAIVVDEDSGAHILPLAASASTAKELLGGRAMDRLLVELRAGYDLVILDAPPVLPVADSRFIAPKADVVVFLARWRKTPQHAIEAAFRKLASAGARLGGVVLTQVDMRGQARYGYGDPGYYYAEAPSYGARRR